MYDWPRDNTAEYITEYQGKGVFVAQAVTGSTMNEWVIIRGASNQTIKKFNDWFR